jgi:uncharacterized protein YrrD
MLRSTKEITGYSLLATDGEIGECKDFLFDDQKWVVRYMVADTGGWLNSEQVIISPLSLGEPDWALRRFPVDLTKEKVRNAPPLEEEMPVSRQYETTLYDHYDYPYYWVGHSLWGPGATPRQLRKYVEVTPPASNPLTTGDPNLRSVKEVTGYHISAQDGEVGHVEDFILDDETWSVRYFVVDTRNWLPGRKVLLSPIWMEDIDWKKQIASVALEQEQIKNSPEYDPETPVNRTYETRLYDFFGRPSYW